MARNGDWKRFFFGEAADACPMPSMLDPCAVGAFVFKLRPELDGVSSFFLSLIAESRDLDMRRLRICPEDSFLRVLISDSLLRGDTGMSPAESLRLDMTESLRLGVITCTLDILRLVCTTWAEDSFRLGGGELDTELLREVLMLWRGDFERARDRLRLSACSLLDSITGTELNWRVFGCGLARGMTGRDLLYASRSMSLNVRLMPFSAASKLNSCRCFM